MLGLPRRERLQVSGRQLAAASAAAAAKAVSELVTSVRLPSGSAPRACALAAALPVAGPDCLAEHVLPAYDGTLSAYLSGTSDNPIARGPALAATAVTHAGGDRR